MLFSRKLLLFLLLQLILFSSFSQSATRNRSWHYPYRVPAIEIKLSIVYEGSVETEEGTKKSFSISWEDTIGDGQGYPKYNRPLELKLVVRDKKQHIAGKYTGLSTQMTHCYFSTNAKEVSLHFWLDKNAFYVIEEQKPRTVVIDSIKNISVTNIGAKFLIMSELFETYHGEYARIKVDLRNVENNIVDGYDMKPTQLVGNPNLVALDYINKGALDPNPMPVWDPGYCQLLFLNRHHIDLKSGKIRTGKHWLRWKGVRKCCEMDFQIIDPHQDYKDLEGNSYSGKALIRKCRLKEEDFDVYQFHYLEDCLPY